MDKQIITVTQLNTFVKDYIDALPPLRQVNVKGEVSNLTKHKTGHYYFTLKDEGSLIKTVMFRADAANLDFDMENGQKVIVTGRVSVRSAASRVSPMVSFTNTQSFTPPQ